ncbi:hypothetical protein J5N97_000504 [Dioscorea zingiberensis]|uniref:Nicastrin n=1 Tax=Dioscorea zingiberensis TaxID=325984 RepID=A0A9D5BSG1_9LILI|nr:hypothetical protein J5N97_000504 [Dioscorea zingiberensis]
MIPTFASNVAGVLVESGPEIQNKLKGFSPALKFPQSGFAPYRSINYLMEPDWIWYNVEHAYNFPVFLLSQSSTLTLQEAALNNEKSKKSYTADVAEFDLVMQCLVIASPINISSSEQSKPIILAVASMDSASFFRDKTFGADSPNIPVDALSKGILWMTLINRNVILSDPKSLMQLVFIVFTGEAWGYLGSRRFLLELDLQSDAVSGLNYSLIERTSSATNETLDALRIAQDSVKSDHIVVLSANASNPGIPPSSLMAFLGKDSLTSGVVLEDFDTVFTNKFYHSHLDDLSNTCPSNYVGVIVDEPSSTPDIGYVSDISSNDGRVCIRAETDGKGVCVVSTTRYVPAYSTRLKFESGSWTVLPPNNSDPMGLLDAIWTESNWNTIGLRVYTVQNSSFDNIVLLGSIAITVLAYLAIVITRAF